MTDKSQRIKVCFYMTGTYQVFANANDGFGGAEVNLYYISKGLAYDSKYAVQFLVGDYGQKDVETWENVTLIKIKYLNPARFIKIHHKILCRWNFIKQILKNKSDIFIVSTAGEFLGYMVFVLKKLKKGKRIIFRTGSDWDIDGTITNYKNHTGVLYSYALKRFDKIIVQNEVQAKTLNDTHGLKSVVIRNGFPISGVKKIGKYILWVGRAIDLKRPELFLQLALRLPDENFQMVLPGQSELKTLIIQKASMIKNLEIYDGVSFFEVFDFFVNAKCFVNTSIVEGSPNTFIQSCLGNTPILSFRVNPENMINEFDLGCYCRDELDVAVRFISGLNDKSIAYYGSNGYKYVATHHDLNGKILQYKNLIKKPDNFL